MKGNTWAIIGYVLGEGERIQAVMRLLEQLFSFFFVVVTPVG